MLAKVITVNGRLMGEIVRPAACGKCGQCQGFEQKRLYELPKGDWKPGDEVNIEVTQMNPMKASALGYGIPLLGLVISVAIASWMGLEDIWQAAFGIGGLALSYITLRLVDRHARKKGAFQTVCTQCEGGIHNG